jgi:hypothetical protein
LPPENNLPKDWLNIEKHKLIYCFCHLRPTENQDLGPEGRRGWKQEVKEEEPFVERSVGARP